jgi:hypothetical protein
MRKFWNSFCNQVKEQRLGRTLVGWFCFIVFFSFVNTIFYDGADTSFATMVAGAALFAALNSQRRLDNK